MSIGWFTVSSELHFTNVFRKDRAVASQTTVSGNSLQCGQENPCS